MERQRGFSAGLSAAWPGRQGTVQFDPVRYGWAGLAWLGGVVTDRHRIGSAGKEWWRVAKLGVGTAAVGRLGKLAQSAERAARH